MKRVLVVVLIVVMLLPSYVTAQDIEGTLYIPKIGLVEPIRFAPIESKRESNGTITPIENRRFWIGTGVNWLEGTDWIDGDNLMVLAGHSDGVFNRLDELTVNDMILVFDDHTVAIYIVESWWIADTDELAWITKRGQSLLRLITCDEDKRLIIQARRVQ